MLKKIWKYIVKIDLALDKQYPIFILLVLVLALRIPNLAEPYWYGDEGIYLTIGQSLNKGAVLYKDIIDHKTPIIYFLAQTHTQLNFRLLNISWMLVTTFFFYYLTKKLSKSVIAAFIASLLFVLGTTLPALEGNIPNGELFVMGFVIVGMYLSLQSWYGEWFLTGERKSKKWQPLVLSGVFLSLGILTKVPAIFDVAAVFSLGYFALLRSIPSLSIKDVVTKLKIQLPLVFKSWTSLAIGLAVPIGISILYFVALGAGKDYLDFGLMYNFRYAGSWQLPFSHPLLLFLFTLPGKVLLLLLLVAIISTAKKWLTPTYQFVLLWSGLALVASSLSNRPYPHYFLQTIPPLALLIGIMIDDCVRFVRYKKDIVQTSLQLFLGVLLISSTVTLFKLLGVSFYPTFTYYIRWMQFAQGKLSPADYNQQFDYLMTDNYKAAKLIRSHENPTMFVWGTNPMLYALSDKMPTGRFTVSFHIKDFKAYDETYQDLVADAPQFIVVMNNETGAFPEFYAYLHANYIPNAQFEHFVVWNKLSSK